MRRYLRDPTFSRFDTILECDRHTHTHTHTQTDGLTDTRRRHIPRLARRRAVIYSLLLWISGLLCEQVRPCPLTVFESDGSHPAPFYWVIPARKSPHFHFRWRLEMRLETVNKSYQRRNVLCLLLKPSVGLFGVLKSCSNSSSFRRLHFMLYDVSVRLPVCLWWKCIVVTVHAGKRGGVISHRAMPATARPSC